jgi:iron complex transport system permease protein
VPVLPLLLALFACLVASMVVALALGSEPLRLAGVWETVRARLSGATGPDPVYDAIVWDLRAPRVLMAAVVGAGLALAGAVMQTLVRNPLADPYLLGVSAGAAVGATLVIVMGVLGGLGIWALSAGALSGAILASLLVFGVAVVQGGLTPLRLVLTGVVLSAAFSSVSSTRGWTRWRAARTWPPPWVCRCVGCGSDCSR